MAMMTEADNRDKAIEHYKQIINDFPEDEYAIRAKNKLDNLKNSTSSIGEYLDKYAETDSRMGSGHDNMLI